MVVGQHFKNAAASSKVMTFDSFGLSVAGVVVEPLETQRRRVECFVSNCNLFIARLPEDPDCSSAAAQTGGPGRRSPQRVDDMVNKPSRRTM